MGRLLIDKRRWLLDSDFRGFLEGDLEPIFERHGFSKRLRMHVVSLIFTGVARYMQENRGRLLPAEAVSEAEPVSEVRAVGPHDQVSAIAEGSSGAVTAETGVVVQALKNAADTGASLVELHPGLERAIGNVEESSDPDPDADADADAGTGTPEVA